MTIVLNDIDVSLNVHDLSEAQAKSLHDIRESCQHVLEDTQKTLNKYSSLASKSADFRERAKRVWKRVKWEPDEVRDLRSRISSNVTVLNSFTAAHTRDTVFKLELRQDHQEQQEILEWLTPVDTGAQQSDFIRRRQPGSGQWLVESREYGKWKATKGEILFCHGMPGAGKTILSSIVVNNLQESDTNKDVAVCYFYCNFQRQDEQRLENIVLGFLKQLAQITTPMPTCLKDLFYRCKAKGGRPSLEESINTLYSVARTFSRIFVVVDALDECQTTEGCQRQLISQLIELKTLIGANILATSRPVPHILGRFKEFVLLEVLASPGDIRKYVVGNMQDLPGFVSRNPNLINEITDKIVAATNGMYVQTVSALTKH